MTFLLVYGNICWLLLFLPCFCHPVDAFVWSSSCPKFVSVSTQQFTLVSLRSKDGDHDDAISIGNKEKLVFKGIIDLSSDPFPEGTTVEEVASFLEEPKYRNFFLSAGGSQPVEELPMTPELESLWLELCRDEFGNDNKPEQGDCILSTDSIIQFPGLKMTTTAINGVKYDKSSDTEMPKYTFMMIAEKQTVKGLPPVVWLFKKLTGADKKGDSLKPSGIAKSEISVLQNNDGRFVVHFDANIKITVEFPAALLKILPTSKEKAEESGSASIAKSISKSVEKTTKGLYGAFMEFKASRK